MTKEKITIGRFSGCDISINDKLLSKIHCTVECVDNVWRLIDGSNKPSTNGTW